MSNRKAQVSPNIFPCLFYQDANAAMDWLTRAFGFVKRMAMPGDNGTIVHAEMTFGSGVIMVGSAKPEHGWVSPANYRRSIR